MLVLLDGCDTISMLKYMTRAVEQSEYGSATLLGSVVHIHTRYGLVPYVRNEQARAS